MLKAKKLNLINVIVYFCISGSMAMRNFDFILTNITCRVYDATLLAPPYCRLCPANGTTPAALDLSFAIKRPPRDWQLHAIFQAHRLRMPESTPYKLVDVEVDLCEFLRTQLRMKIFMIVYKTLQKYIDPMPSCPLKLNYRYNYTNVQLDPDDYPAYTPEGSYKAILEFHESEKINFISEISMDVTYKNRVKKRLLHFQRNF